MNFLAQLTLSQWLLAILLIVVCLLLILIILLQKGRGQGLSGAFGGGGGGGAFGAKTGDVFTWVTVIFASIFILVAVVANFAFDDSPKPTPPITISSEDIIPSETPLEESPDSPVPTDLGDVDFVNPTQADDGGDLDELQDTQEKADSENPPANNDGGF